MNNANIVLKQNTASLKFAAPQSTTSQFTVTLIVNKMGMLQAYLASFSSRLSALPDPMNFVLQCHPCVTVKEGCIDPFSQSV